MIHEAIMPAPEIIPWPGSSRMSANSSIELEPRPADHMPPDVLFAKITDEQIEEWKARFGGTEAG